MTGTQILTIVLASVPTSIVVLVGILLNNVRVTDLDRKIDRRFDEMKELWRSELHRVEKILDARLKHIEER